MRLRSRSRPWRGRAAAVLAGALALSATLAACTDEPVEYPLPTPEQAAEYYETRSEADVELSGNVVELTVEQSSEDLRRGGSIWARVGPYVFLFHEGTRELFRDWPGVAAVRVVTRSSGGGEVARAMLRRDALNAGEWRRMIYVAGRARVQGTDRPALLEELIRRGQNHTEYEYAPRYVPR